MKTIPKFNEFKGDTTSRQPRRMNEANSDQFFKTYEETENWLIEMGVGNFYIDPDTLVVNVNGYVSIKNESIKRLPVKFGKVSRSFIVRSCGLASLIGCPDTVGSDPSPHTDGFNVSDNDLTVIDFFPEVNGNIDLGNNKLTSLKGVQQVCNGDFNCGYNKIRSAVGGPKTMVRWGILNFHNNLLTDLIGTPTNVYHGNFVNNNLTSLKGSPKQLTYLNVDNNKLKNLKDAPEIIEFDLSCRGNLMTSMADFDYDIEVKELIIDKANYFKKLKAKKISRKR